VVSGTRRRAVVALLVTVVAVLAGVARPDRLEAQISPGPLALGRRWYLNASLSHETGALERNDQVYGGLSNRF